MKQLIALFLLITTGLSLTSAQGKHLVIGEKFEYWNTRYYQYGSDIHEGKVQNTSESYSLEKYRFKVIKKDSTGTYLSCIYDLDSEYSRKKVNEKWETAISHYTEYENEHTRKNYKGELELELHLSTKGNLINIVVKHSSGSHSAPKEPSELKKYIRMHHSILWHCFQDIPKNIKVGSKHKIEGEEFTLKSKDQNSLHFTSTHDVHRQKDINYKDSHTLASYSSTYNNNGLLKEGIVDSRWSAKGFKDKKIYNSKSRTSRIVFVQEATEKIECTIRNNKKQESLTSYTFENQSNNKSISHPNTCIRGKIKAPDQRTKISLSWIERSALDYSKTSITVPLKEDSTFEIKLHLDEIANVTLSYQHVASFYLLPGDDIILDIDKNKGLVAKGIGANHVNLALKKDTFEKANKCTKEYINIHLNKSYTTDSPEEIKQYAHSILEKKQAFLINESHSVSPEVFLALFWDNQLFIANSLREAPRKIRGHYRQSQRGDFNIEDELEFGGIDDIFHPDNNLMAFSSNYDSNLRHLVMFHLLRKMKISSGRGNNLFTNKYQDDYFEQMFNYAQTFFTGKTQESLCYSAVYEAQRRTHWACYEQLYHKYATLFPASSRLEELECIYIRAKSVSPGKTPYNFKLSDIKGKTHQLSDYKGKAVYLSITPAIDKYFERYAEYYNNLYETYQDSNIVFIHICLTSDKSKVKSFINNLELKGTFLFAGKLKRLIKSKYNFEAIPYFCLIDANQKIVSSSRISTYDLIDNPNILSAAMTIKETPIDFKERSQKLSIIIFSLLITLIIVFLSFFLIKKRNTRELKLANLNQQLHESELKAIRAQMNPHFIHNCLNSIQNLVQKKENEKAHLYISKFATLIRDTLNLSNKQEIPLSQELEMLSNYITLEELRFKH